MYMRPMKLNEAIYDSYMTYQGLGKPLVFAAYQGL